MQGLDAAPPIQTAHVRARPPGHLRAPTPVEGLVPPVPPPLYGANPYDHPPQDFEEPWDANDIAGRYRRDQRFGTNGGRAL
jgi:hypothetical protein